MKSKKVVAVLLAIGLLLPVFSSCSKKIEIQDSIIVSENDVWYDSLRFKIKEPEIDPDYKLSMAGYEFYNDKLYITYQKTSIDAYWDVSTLLQVYDMDGNNDVFEIDYPEKSEDLILRPQKIMPNEDGKTATVIVQKSYVGIMDWKYYTSTIDLETGKAGEFEKVDINGTDYVVLELKSVGKYTCYIASKVNSSDPYVYFIYEGNKLINMYETKDFAKEFKHSFMYLEDITTTPESDDLSCSFYTDVGRFTCKLDPVNGVITDPKDMTTEEYLEQLGDTDEEFDVESFTSTTEGELLNIGTLGDISKFDPDKKTIEKLIDRNDYSPFFSDYSYVDYTEANVISHNDDRTVILFTTDDLAQSTSLAITVLRKASTNPHAGKKVIEIESPDSCSVYLSSAIYNFNKTDPDYLIRVWDKHNEFNNITTNVSKQLDTNEVSYLKSSGEVIGCASPDDMLVEELAAGDKAPDLIMNLRYGKAFNEDYLIDMSDYLDDDVKAELFTNFVDSSKYNDKLYFMPINVYIDGIVCTKEDLDMINAGYTGFTFETYDAFVKGPNNGEDPYYTAAVDEVNGGIIMYPFIESCIDTVDAIQGKKVDFDTEQFRRTLKYFFEETVPNLSEIQPDEEYIPTRPNGSFARLSSYEDFILACQKPAKDYCIMGTPCIEERGPRFRVAESVSVYAGSDVQEGAKRFINYLMGGSFMNEDDLIDKICINKTVMSNELPLLTERNNKLYYRMFNDGFRPDDIFQNLANESTEAALLDAMSKVSTYNMEDREIREIMEEEFAGYGFKDTDELIKILNDRVSKVVEERK